MSPIEIGAAAGYETCRKWAHNHTVFDPIYGDDSERQRDALIGIAIAEGARIFSSISFICVCVTLIDSFQSLA
jgi:hypothetical protein